MLSISVYVMANKIFFVTVRRCQILLSLARRDMTSHVVSKLCTQNYTRTKNVMQLVTG